jgi:hypothetical protein
MVRKRRRRIAKKLVVYLVGKNLKRNNYFFPPHRR